MSAKLKLDVEIDLEIVETTIDPNLVAIRMTIEAKMTEATENTKIEAETRGKTLDLILHPRKMN